MSVYRKLWPICGRRLHTSPLLLRKGDLLPIDAFRLPLQVSINEWEFRYDFSPRDSSIKVPAINREAVRKDIAAQRAQDVSRQILLSEGNSSIKVEANTAQVVSGGESVPDDPEQIPMPLSLSTAERGGIAKPVPPAKRTGRDTRYLQCSINPEINKGVVVQIGDVKVHVAT